MADSKLQVRNGENQNFSTINFVDRLPSLVATVYRKNDAERLVSCWNACEHLEHPESDIKKLVEALKIARDFTDEDSQKAIDKALILVEGVGKHG